MPLHTSWVPRKVLAGEFPLVVLQPAAIGLYERHRSSPSLRPMPKIGVEFPHGRKPGGGALHGVAACRGMNELAPHMGMSSPSPSLPRELYPRTPPCQGLRADFLEGAQRVPNCRKPRRATSGHRLGAGAWGGTAPMRSAEVYCRRAVAVCGSTSKGVTDRPVHGGGPGLGAPTGGPARGTRKAADRWLPGSGARAPCLSRAGGQSPALALWERAGCTPEGLRSGWARTLSKSRRARGVGHAHGRPVIMRS
jgi:hypothetical protein